MLRESFELIAGHNAGIMFEISIAGFKKQLMAIVQEYRFEKINSESTYFNNS